jgi:hypothetical protein
VDSEILRGIVRQTGEAAPRIHVINPNHEKTSQVHDPRRRHQGVTRQWKPIESWVQVKVFDFLVSAVTNCREEQAPAPLV